MSNSTTVCPQTHDFPHASLAELADHIEITHHKFLRDVLPRLDFFTEKVARNHGTEKPQFAELRQVFVALREELEAHLAKEEQILFPLCRRLQAAGRAVESHCGSVTNPIAVMVREHDDATAAVARMRELTDGYAIPEGSCDNFRTFMTLLADLEADLRLHIHKENEILFPRAVEIERQAAV